ncbi:MAG TPA: hypothetical protein VFV51_09280 [Vicinamibacterales bacterium]|nr:hypothetical protein [Vicinamibacterales bacterium]
MPRTLLAIVVLALLASSGVHGQMAHRLKGSLRTTANVALANATVRANAITGFRGEPFAGASEQSTSSLPSGEWNITNLEAGLWMFSTSAPDMVPAAIVIPVKFSQRQQVSAVGNAINWQLPLWAMPLNEHQILKVAIDLLASGKPEEAAQALTVALAPDTKDDTRVAAGEMALIARQHALAKTLFDMVLQQQPKHPRAKLGAASAALLARQWEAAGKLVWDARDLAPKEQRPALAAAIDDLRAIARIQ